MSNFPTLNREDKIVFIASLRGQIANLKRIKERGLYGKGQNIKTIDASIVKARLTIRRLREELGISGEEKE